MRLRRIVVEWMRETVKPSPELANRFNMPAIIRGAGKRRDRILRKAPHIIVAHAPADLAASPVSTMLSLEYVELYAPALGLGTCWAGFAQACHREFPAFSQFLKIPARRTITGILMVGYPKYKYHRLPARNLWMWLVETATVAWRAHRLGRINIAACTCSTIRCLFLHDGRFFN